MEKLLDGVAVQWKPLGKALVRTKGRNRVAQASSLRIKIASRMLAVNFQQGFCRQYL